MEFKNKVFKCAKQHCSAKFVHFIQARFVILDISPALSAQLIRSFENKRNLLVEYCTYLEDFFMSILDLLDHPHFQFDAAVTCTFPDAFATFTLPV